MGETYSEPAAVPAQASRPGPAPGTGSRADAPRYRASGDFLIREIAGEIVMVPVGTRPGQLNGMLTVNESFRFLWQLFQTPHTVPEAAQAVLEHYDGTEEQVTKDINDFVKETVDCGFLIKEEL